MREPVFETCNGTAYRAYSSYTTRNTATTGSRRYSSTEAKYSKRVQRRVTVKESFFVEFAEEIDLFCLETRFPEWIIQYREEILNKIGRNFRKICRKLKDSGLKFYIKYKYPIEIDGKWKFADIYIPKGKTIVLLLSDKDLIGHPCNMRSDKERWFEDRFRVVGIYYSEVGNVVERLGL